jgi:hypothetical protein
MGVGPDRDTHRSAPPVDLETADEATRAFEIRFAADLQ